jgi:hypothetical protein
VCTDPLRSRHPHPPGWLPHPHEATALRVQFTLPVPVSAAVKQALAVRVLDAVRSAGRTYGPAKVSVHAPA